MARASSRVAKGPIWMWRRLSFGSFRMTALYPRFLRAATRISASSWREMAATWTIDGVPVVVVAGVEAGEVDVAVAGDGAGAAFGAGAADSSAASPAAGLGLGGTGLSSGSGVSCLTTVPENFEA